MDRTRQPKQQEIFSVTRSGYEIPKRHILYKIKNVYDFERWYPILMPLIQKKRGRKPRDILIKAKMMLLAYLYGLSDREIEGSLNENLVYRWFCDLTLTEDAPDHTQLSRLRKKIGGRRVNELFEDIVQVARDKGMITDKWSAVDATHILADVSESRRSVNNKTPEVSKEQRNPKAWRKEEPKGPTDLDARWGCKKKDYFFYGYKMPAAIDVESYMFTKIHTSSGEAHDGKNLIQVIDPKAKNIKADKIYDDMVNDYILKELGIRNWIYREKKKVARWLIDIRSCIERKFGEAKHWHEFERSRYRGLKKVLHHCYWTVMALNLKRVAVLA